MAPTNNPLRQSRRIQKLMVLNRDATMHQIIGPIYTHAPPFCTQLTFPNALEGQPHVEDFSMVQTGCHESISGSKQGLLAH